MSIGTKQKKGASPKQINLLKKLAVEKANGHAYIQTQLNSLKAASVEEISSLQATNIIGVLLMEPNAKGVVAPKASNFVTEQGIYMVDGTVYSVVKAQAGHLYAKTLKIRVVDTCGGCEACDGENLCEKKKGVWEFAKGAMKDIRPEHKMTVEAAEQYGALHGVCCACGRTLKKKESVLAGIGPICAGKF